MKQKTLLVSLLAVVMSLCSPGSAAAQASFEVVPRPLKITPAVEKGDFALNAKTVIVCGKAAEEQTNARHLQRFLTERTGFAPAIVHKAPQTNAIVLSQNLKNDNLEAYHLTVTADRIHINGASAAGTFYGIQTLRKSLPHNSHKGKITPPKGKQIYIPFVTIDDAPRFAYRGALLDVARHFLSVDSVKRFIDMIALHNINRFHWHLTDDQGWRVEIKKHPRLVEVGSKRPETVIGHNSGKYDGIPHGGYYTQEECRDIVRYAAERHITIIPEIDLPGHMLGALTAYPELGCTGGPYAVWRIWGVSDDVLCAGNPKTYDFIDDVLDEIVKIFPSEYIHVGGDECPKTRWKSCPKCQAFIKQHQLEGDGKHTAEERLQSYVIRHAEQHLSRRGRKIIGWDETLEGGLAPGATVMSWRGEAGGLEAARSGHDAIMTPNTYLYFDYYQAKDTKQEPMAIGGYLPLTTVYSYEPVPEKATPEEARHIIGVQANLWTEYIPNFKQIEYMELPRMAALAEIQWTPRNTKNFPEFIERLTRLLDLYREQNYNFAKHLYNVTASYQLDAERGIVATLSTLDNADIRYTLDGSTPTTSSTLYKAPIVLQKDAQLRAAAFRNLGRPRAGSRPMVERSQVEQEDFHFSLSTAKDIRLLQGINDRYKFAGPSVLVDGLQGSNLNFQSGRWLGFSTEDLEAVIDLGRPTTVSSVSFNALVEKANWIYGPRRVVVSLSTDGQDFTPVVRQDYLPMGEKDSDGILPYRYTFAPQSARYIKVHAVPEKAIPTWHTVAAGKPGFIFIDEIVVK